LPSGGGVVVTCDRCDEPFDEEIRVPTILPDCAHTLCAKCIKEIIEDASEKSSERGFYKEKRCPLCGTEIDEHHNALDFKVNFKLLSLLN
jgi:hypothetical protein